MSSISDYVVNKVNKAEVATDPFPHFYVENIFPDDFYQEMMANMPDLTLYEHIFDGHVTPITDNNTETNRSILPLPCGKNAFWDDLIGELKNTDLVLTMLNKFRSHILERNPPKPLNVHPTFSLVRDRRKYSIGPHTDLAERLVTSLFYLPKDNTQMHLGTKLYKAKDKSFKCLSGLHYDFDNFEKVKSVAFQPNSYVAFCNSDVSFHGVEAVQEDIERNALLFYIMCPQVYVFPMKDKGWCWKTLWPFEKKMCGAGYATKEEAHNEASKIVSEIP